MLLQVLVLLLVIVLWLSLECVGVHLPLCTHSSPSCVGAQVLVVGNVDAMGLGVVVVFQRERVDL